MAKPTEGSLLIYSGIQNISHDVFSLLLDLVYTHDSAKCVGQLTQSHIHNIFGLCAWDIAVWVHRVSLRSLRADCIQRKLTSNGLFRKQYIIAPLRRLTGSRTDTNV